MSFKKVIASLLLSGTIKIRYTYYINKKNSLIFRTTAFLE